MAFSSDIERFARIFGAALAPLLVGCGIDEDQFTVDVCSGGFHLLGSIEPARPVDYLELRELDPEIDPVFGETLRVVDSVGQKCSAASDVDVCLEKFAMLPTDSNLSGSNSVLSPTSTSLAYTRGDEVSAIPDLSDLVGFLRPIDTVADAVMVGTSAGHELLCSEPHQVGEHPEGHVLYTTSGQGCGAGNDIMSHVVLVRTDGSISVLESKRIERGDPGCAIGRMPPGLCRQRVRAVGPVGRFFAEVAQLEAASAPAFAQLAKELAAHGAPRGFVRAALRARDDERRHARATAALARRHGGLPVAARVQATATRPLVEVLADNAAEGCVRETFGALVAHVQARRAGDPQVRRALATIAGEETRHAALSWRLARWGRQRLNAVERRRVARAGAEAIERFAEELVRPHDVQVHALAGLPEPAEAERLFARMRAALRAEARA